MIRLLLLVLVVTGCTRGGEPRIVVAAASDLAAAMPELAEAFREQTGIEVDATLGSSGQIANQILHGAPIDVFASADRGWIERLAEGGRLDEAAGPALYAWGRLVMLVPADRQPPADIEALRGPAIRRIAIANPEHAPYGVAARQALVAAGLWDELQPRIIIGENVRQAHRFAELGSVDVAITARSLVGAAGTNWTIVPDTLHAPLAQTVAVVRGRPHMERARAFLRFMTGPAARDILERHNFVLP